MLIDMFIIGQKDKNVSSNLTVIWTKKYSALHLYNLAEYWRQKYIYGRPLIKEDDFIMANKYLLSICCDKLGRE